MFLHDRFEDTHLPLPIYVFFIIFFSWVHAISKCCSTTILRVAESEYERIIKKLFNSWLSPWREELTLAKTLKLLLLKKKSNFSTWFRRHFYKDYWTLLKERLLILRPLSTHDTIPDDDYIDTDSLILIYVVSCNLSRFYLRSPFQSSFNHLSITQLTFFLSSLLHTFFSLFHSHKFSLFCHTFSSFNQLCIILSKKEYLFLLLFTLF